MASKRSGNKDGKAKDKQRSPGPATRNTKPLGHQFDPVEVIQRAVEDPGALSPADVVQLQQTIGNQGVRRLIGGSPTPGRQATQDHSLAPTLSRTIQGPGAARGQGKPAYLKSLSRPVVNHLASLSQGHAFDSTLYRKEIAAFQREHPAAEIATKQDKFLEPVKVQQRSKTQVMRACGGGSKPKETVDPKVALKKAAESLVETGGTADDGDKDVVVKELLKIPLVALSQLKKKGVKVVVCRNSVTEIKTELKGVRPRGWPAGKTWDAVPGLYDGGAKRVIIATRKGRVPPPGDGHGSHNLVLHEVGHAIGETVSKGSEEDPKFIAARNKDKARLDAYEGQAGTAGIEETYAESFGRFYGKDPADKKAYPNLHKYWAGNPFVTGTK
jgi:hypothetical protein